MIDFKSPGGGGQDSHPKKTYYKTALKLYTSYIFSMIINQGLPTFEHTRDHRLISNH